MINVEYIHPPVPSRQFDYSATLDGYEPGDPIGFGPTPEAARDALQGRLDEISCRSENCA